MKRKRRPTQSSHTRNKRFSITFLPERKTIPAEKGKTILNIAFDNDIVLEHICGGVGACTSCIIKIIKGLKYFNSISKDELYQLKKSVHFSPNLRLGCICKIIKEPKENIVIEIPEYSEEDDK